jgi:uncharacterized protein
MRLLLLCAVALFFLSHSVEAAWKKILDTLTIEIAEGQKHKFRIEIADNEAERRQGLMGRSSLNKNQGMLFVFENSDYQEFWMKDTLISLDILFIDSTGRIVHIAERAKPNDLTALPSTTPVKAALEILGGQSANLGIKKGDLVKYKLFTK